MIHVYIPFKIYTNQLIQYPFIQFLIPGNPGGPRLVEWVTKANWLRGWLEGPMFSVRLIS